jgi:hypothetical protein
MDLVPWAMFLTVQTLALTLSGTSWTVPMSRGPTCSPAHAEVPSVRCPPVRN